MKSLKLSLATAVLITGMSITTASAITVGDTTANNNVGILAKIIKSQNIDKMLKRTNALDQYVENYILLTGKIDVTKADLQNRLKLNDAAFTNFTGQSDVTFNVDTDNYRLDVGHLFNSPIDSITLNILKASSALATNGVIVPNPKGSMYDPEIYYQFSPTVINYIDKIKRINADSDNIISETAPTDTTKIWYKPTGDGDFQIFKNIDGVWKSAGNLNKSTGIVVTSKDKLNDLNNVAAIGTKAYVKSGNGLETYVFDGTKWEQTSAGAGTLFNGTATIKDLATTIFDKAGGSVATVIAPDKEWSGSLNFTKKDDTATGGYWISSNNKFVVFKNISEIPVLNSYFNIGTYAWIPDANGNILKLQKKEIPNRGVAWVYIANDLQDALHYLNTPRNTLAGEIVYVKDKNVYLQRSAEDKTLQPVTGKYFVSSEGRGLFSDVLSGYTYLTETNDCSADTCYSNGTYKIDDLTTFYYAPTADKLLNGLTDAGLCNSNSSCYNLYNTKHIPVALYNNKEIIFYKNGYWVNSQGKYLGKHYNNWFANSNMANNIYGYEHGAYVYRDGSRYPDHKHWKKYSTSCANLGNRFVTFGPNWSHPIKICKNTLFYEGPSPYNTIWFSDGFQNCCLRWNYAWGWR